MDEAFPTLPVDVKKEREIETEHTQLVSLAAVSRSLSLISKLLSLSLSTALRPSKVLPRSTFSYRKLSFAPSYGLLLALNLI